MILSRPKLATILASFHKTIDNLVTLQEYNERSASDKKMQVDDLNSDIDVLVTENATARSVVTKLRELIS